MVMVDAGVHSPSCGATVIMLSGPTDIPFGLRKPVETSSVFFPSGDTL